MRVRSVLAKGAVALGLLVTGIAGAFSQTSFRPGRDGGEFSGYEEYRALLDNVGLLRAEPEIWTPLPRAREIMDQLATNGDLKDDVLKDAWERMGRLSGEIEALWPDCEIRGIRGITDRLDQLRRLGEDLRRDWAEVAQIRDGVVALYTADLDLFVENVGGSPDVWDVAGHRALRMGSNQLLGQINQAVGGSGMAARAGFLRFLGVAGATFAVADGAVMAYEAFLAYQRLPHILEKYEMLSYLNALMAQYVQTLETINALRGRVIDRIAQACPCLPSRLVPDGQLIDVSPDDPEFRLNSLYAELAELRRRASASGQSPAVELGVGARIGEVQRMIDEVSRRSTRRSSTTGRARRSWAGQIEDNAQTRRHYEAYRSAATQAARARGTLQRQDNPFEGLSQRDPDDPSLRNRR